MKSKDYFDGISNVWDEIRQSFFSDSIGAGTDNGLRKRTYPK